MRYTKGIILAAGRGTRLMPVTTSIPKPILPIFDKPMIYYALTTLMSLGIKKVLFILRKQDLKLFKEMFGSGAHLGMKISYAFQKNQIGIPDAMIVGKNFINNGPFVIALADNLFIGKSFNKTLAKIQKIKSGAVILATKSSNPSKSAVIEYSSTKKILSIEEKPRKPKSNYVIPGLYFYDGESIKYTKKLKPSKRGELEITDVHQSYLKDEKLKVVFIEKDVKWFDAGDFKEIMMASNYVSKYQNKSNDLVGSIELISFKNKWINRSQFSKLVKKLPNSKYKDFLTKKI